MKTFQQIPLQFPPQDSWTKEDFLVAPCNKDAFDMITQEPLGPQTALWLIGEKGSGKTHLAHLFSDILIPCSCLTQEEIPALAGKKVVIEDLTCHQTDEVALFHLYNLLKETAGELLLTAKEKISFRLPDLDSRLKTAPVVQIGLPDDVLIASLFIKMFYDRHIAVSGEAVNYLVTHTERSFDAIRRMVAQLDDLSLSAKQKITIPLIKKLYE
jgi:chromosomal replication initiation ATPase DnaA